MLEARNRRGVGIQYTRIARPNSAPAYYQGRPVRLWISAMRPRRSRTASHHVMETVTGCRERTPSEHGLFADAGSKPPA